MREYFKSPRCRNVRDLLWEWIEYHEGNGVMPGKICRGDGGKVNYMTVFDPRVLDRLVGKKK